MSRTETGVITELTHAQKGGEERRPRRREGDAVASYCARAAPGGRGNRSQAHDQRYRAALNVSKKTVSRVINESPFVREETRTRIAEIIERVGFTPDPQARGLAFRRSFLIGLVYDNPNAPYVINIQEGALGALRRWATSSSSTVRSQERGS